MISGRRETVEEGVIYKTPIKLMIVLSVNPNLVLVNITQRGKKSYQVPTNITKVFQPSLLQVQTNAKLSSCT